MQIYIGNNNQIELHDLRDVTTGTPDNTAAVEVTLRDATSGNPVEGQAWPTTMDPQGSGLYTATLQSLLELNPNCLYTANITARTTTNVKGDWSLQVTAKVRR